MYRKTLDALCTTADGKAAFLARNPLGYMVSAMLAGAYVGVGVFASFAVGGPLAAEHSPFQKLVMGATFAVALSLVVFAGAELFTGNNLVCTVGCRWGRATLGALARLWSLSWLGNLLGAVLLAVILYYSTVLNGGPELALVQKVAEKKMHLSIVEMLTRGALCNWLVCLAVWCAARMQSESGKLIMIFWCLYAFVATGFEHSIANMTLLSLALLQPHTPAVTLAGMGANLLWVTLGNIIGGALFVGLAYCTTSRNDEALETKAPSVPV